MFQLFSTVPGKTFQGGINSAVFTGQRAWCRILDAQYHPHQVIRHGLTAFAWCFGPHLPGTVAVPALSLEAKAKIMQKPLDDHKIRLG